MDLVVVGAGPAGTAAALGALRADPWAKVVLLDRAAFPRDKACGDGIAPQALDELARLGVHGAAAGSPEVPLLALRPPGALPEDAVVGRAPRPSRVVPRAVFDARLVAAAVGAGADLRQHRVRKVSDVGDAVEVDGQFSAPVVVAADGASSVLRRAVGVGRNADPHLAVAVRGYTPATDVALKAVAAGHAAPAGRSSEPGEVLRIDLVAEGWPAYAWSFPLGDGRANVGYGMRRSGRGGIPPGPGLAERLAAALPEQPADPATLATHHLPLSSGRPRAAVGRVLLTGDAASLINPLTGEGIFYAIASGRLAGIAAVRAPHAAGALYRRLLGRRLGRHLRHTRALAALITSLPLTRSALEVTRDPAVFAEVSELGLGDGLVSAGTVARIVALHARGLVTR